MSYVRKNSTMVFGSILGVLVLAALAMWQFYLFVTFKDENGLVVTQGGTHHLWWAIGMGLFACLTGFLIFSALVQHDTDDELHITS
jgi:amino acid permease